MGRVDRFVKNRNDVEPPKSPFGNDKRTSNHASTERHRRVDDLRVKVPVTRLEAKPEGNNVSSLTTLAKALAARHPLRSDSDLGSVSTISKGHNITDLEQQKSKFDDTELEDSTISSLDGIPQEQRCVMSTDYNRFSPEVIRTAHEEHYEQQYAEAAADDDEGHPNPKIEEDGDHRRNDLYADDMDEIQFGPVTFDEIAVARRNVADNVRYLHSQSPLRPNVLRNPVPVRSTSPMAFRNLAPRSSQRSTMAPPTPNPQKSSVVIQPVTTTTQPTTFDKTSSYTDSSATTTPPPPEYSREKNKKKRPISDLLDYDRPALKSISFTDLDNQPFDLDPRRPAQATSTANLDPHLQKLSTLKSLSDTERAKLFSAQTKDQWTASAEFFENRLGELCKELRLARDRRRDVTARYEAEVRERMGMVAGSGEGIERSLGEMRGRARGVLPTTSTTHR